MGIKGIVNFRLLLIVFAIGGVIIIGSEMMRPSHWSWLIRDSIPHEEADIKPLEKRVYYPGVNKEALQTIIDNSKWWPQDTEAWKNLVEILRDVPQSELNKYSFGHVPYVQLKSTPKTFRGVLVNVRGNARQCVQIEQNRNDVDIKYIYRIVIFPDSNPSEPVVINSLNLPPGFPLGNEIKPQRIECTGFFVKCWAYMAQDDVMLAPLILAKEISWQEPVEDTESQGEPSFWIILVVIIIVSIILYVIIQQGIKASLPPKPRKIPVEEFVFIPPTENEDSSNS